MKEKIRTCGLFFMLILLFNACNKIELDEPTEYGHRFELKGLKDGTSFYLGIGDPEFEMLPHYSLDEDQLWHLAGTIKSRHSHGLPQMSIVLRNYHMGRSLPHFNDLQAGRHPFFNLEGIKTQMHPLHIKLSEHAGLQIDSIRLSGDRGFENHDDVVVHMHQLSEQFLRISYSAGSLRGCSFTTRADALGTEQAVIANWHVADYAGDTVRLAAHIHGYDLSYFSSVTWSTGEKSWEILVNEPGWYALTLTDYVGNTYTHRKFLNKQNGSYHTYGDNLRLRALWLEPETMTDWSQPGSMDIKYKDEAGSEYFLDPMQAEDAFIYIEPQGVPHLHPSGTKAVNCLIRFSAALKSADGKRVKFENVEGLISIGLPD